MIGFIIAMMVGAQLVMLGMIVELGRSIDLLKKAARAAGAK